MNRILKKISLFAKNFGNCSPCSENLQETEVTHFMYGTNSMLKEFGTNTPRSGKPDQ